MAWMLTSGATPAEDGAMKLLIILGALASAAAGSPPAADQFRDALLAANSATAVLQTHCPPETGAIRAEQVAGTPPAPPADLRAALAIGPDEPVRYRRVRLMCGPIVFSEADNWYLPGRLTPQMNMTLETSDTPFGRVVAPLKPVRKTLQALPAADPAFLSVTAVLITAEGQPISGVIEVYQKAVLGPGARGPEAELPTPPAPSIRP